MSVSNFIDGSSTSLPYIPPLPPLRESPRVISFSEPNFFLQDSDQIKRASSCATCLFGGFAASSITKNPIFLLMGFCRCLPKAYAQQKIGNEFQVNTYTDRSQSVPSVTGLSNGNFVVTWKSDDQDGSSAGIYGQLFDRNATRIRTEFQINTYTDSSQFASSVTGLSNDNFVVTWTSYSQDGSSYGIYGQLFDRNATRIRTEFQINTYTNNSQQLPFVASLNNDNFVVTWESEGQDGSDYGVFGQLFAEDASKIGSEFQVNTYSNLRQAGSAVTGLNDGNFVVSWISMSQDGDGWGVYGQLFNGNVTRLGNEFQINTYSADDQRTPSVASLSNGNFIVTWTSDDQDGSDYGVFGQIFAADTSKIGNEFQINTYTENHQSLPSVTGLNHNNFVVTWSNSETFFQAVRGQLFDINGSKMGGEFQINTYRSSGQTATSVINLRNDHFVVVWQSRGQDGSMLGIFGQLFNDFIITSSSSSSTTFTTSTISSSILATSGSNRPRTIVWLSLGVGGLLCFCVTSLSILLLRRKKSQTEARFYEETGFPPTTFKLKPVVQRHEVIGKAYFLLSTLVREEAEEIYLQTGYLIPFPEGQKKVPYVIGSGQFGKIKVAQRIEDKQYVASKKVKGEENMRASETEAQMQKEAAGENVLPIYNTIRLEDALYHFMPLAGLGDGSTIQRRLALLNQSPLAITILTFIAQNILTGLQTIHAKDIDHLDMKPDNLVFTSDGTAYITDFGCAQRPKSRHLTGEALGDNRYFSPERLQSCKESTFDAEKTDMWAAGVTLLQIFYNQDPLQLFNLPPRLAARVERCNQAHFDQQLQRFSEVEEGSIWWVIKGLLDTNPKTRLTATQTLKARCFQGFDKTQQEQAFEELRRETFAQQSGIETSQVNLRDYRWVMQRVPEEERGQAYSSEQNQQFYGYTLTPELYQFTPEHVSASSAASGY